MQPTFEISGEAPAPSQSFWHCLVKIKPGSIGPVVVLTEFPKKRLNQTWTRDSPMNPSERVMSLEDILTGNYKDEFENLFGAEKYESLIEHVRSLCV